MPMAFGLHYPLVMMKSPWALLAFSVLLFGCQTGSPMQASEGGSFMSLWNTYARCQAESDLEQLKHEALVLKTAASRSVTPDSFIIPLPGKIQRLVTAPSARFAVDVKAMAASCSLRAGQVAMQIGKSDEARSFLESVLEYRQADYAYYSTQAKSILSELDNPAVKVSLRIP